MDSVAYFTVGQTRQLDRRCAELSGISGFELMQRAAAAGFAALRWRWPTAAAIEVFCGAGNNGGDGYLIALLALRAGLRARIWSCGGLPSANTDAAQASHRARDAGVEIRPFTSGGGLESGAVIVDALLGTGLNRAPADEFTQAIACIREGHTRGHAVMSVDIPSGLCADTGAVLGEAVQADLTVTFIVRKLGLVTGQGPAYCGEIVLADLDAPAAARDGIPPVAIEAGESLRLAHLPPRTRTAYKTRHGHVLCVGGDHGMAGAVRLAGEAALRAGAGLVSVATRPEHAHAMAQARPELMARGVCAADADFDGMIERADVTVIGPGLGQGHWGNDLLQRVFASAGALVLDADALNLLAAQQAPLRREAWILTPHPGEAARLLGCTTADVERDRPAAVAAIRQRYGGVAVLKGAGTLIAGTVQTWVCTAGNPGMAAAGMGDVLAGVIASLLAQGVEAEIAAALGVYLHARAGDLAALDGERGLQPSDLFVQLRQIVNP